MLHLTCRFCGETKPAKKFRADKTSAVRDEQGTGRRNYCYVCLYVRYKPMYVARAKRLYAANKELSKQKSQQWKENNREQYRAYQREYHKAWAKTNRDKIRSYSRKRYAQRRLNAKAAAVYTEL